MRNFGVRNDFTQHISERGDNERAAWPDRTLPFLDVDPPYYQPWTFGEVAALVALGLAGWACIAAAVVVIARYRGWL